MMKFVLLALLLSASAPETDQRNTKSIATARAVVAEMIRIAVTPEEKALAERDRMAVERATELLAKRAAATRGTGGAREAEEAQISFNRQYLQLQSQMQHENRSYTAISNIMRVKHDTVKNSISNIR